MPAGKLPLWIFWPMLVVISLCTLVIYGSYLADIATAFKEPPPVAVNVQAEQEYRQAIKYATGDGVVQNKQKAIDLLKQSAEHGFNEAQFLLADAYYRGELNQDYRQAYVWFTVATHNGQARAAALRYEVAAYLSPAELKAAQQEVQQLLAKTP